VVALDPNPAAGDDGVTHPHVRNESLCEGEGRTAIRAALDQGRLGDFFLLVAQLLHTYARGSGFVELSNWDGTPCDSCGESLSEDDRSYCRNCDSTLCGSCTVPCQGCEQDYCANCLQPCAGCGGEHCDSCLATCPVCRKQFCADCREEKGLCHACFQKQHHEENPKHDPQQNQAQKRPAGRSASQRRRSRASAPA
jgi:hypothetical protein